MRRNNAPLDYGSGPGQMRNMAYGRDLQQPQYRDQNVRYGGAYENFRPAVLRKPEQRGFMARVVKAARLLFNRPDPEDTSEQGASAAASPSTYQLTLLEQRYSRRELILDCRLMAIDEPRCRRSVQMFADEAMRQGFVLSIDEKASTASAGKLKQAQADIERIQGIVNAKAVSWAFSLITEGDLFVQAVLEVAGSDRDLIDAVRMPAASMERMTDDQDRFIDPETAFAQIDTVSNEQVAVFAEAIMFHSRWNHIDGDRYGLPETVAGRKLYKLIELMEAAQAVRRMTRATQRILWVVGTEEDRGTEKEIEEFKSVNGFVEGVRDIFNPNETARDFFGNGGTSMQTLPADTGVSDVEDIKYLQNVYTSSALPTPGPLYNLDAGAVNRDVVKDLRAEWGKQTKKCSTQIGAVVHWLVELQFLLHDIIPETIAYKVRESESNTLSPEDRVTMIKDALGMATADYKPVPIISHKTAITNGAEFFGVENIEDELKAINAEMIERAKLEQKIALEQKKSEGDLEIQQQAQAASLGQAGPPQGGAGGANATQGPLGGNTSGEGQDADPEASIKKLLGASDSWRITHLGNDGDYRLTRLGANGHGNGNGKH